MIINRTHGGNASGHILRIVVGISLIAILLLVSSAGAAPYAYVTNSNSNNVYVIDTADDSVAATVNVGSSPWGVEVNPAGTKVYITNSESNTVSVIDTTDNSVTATVNVGGHPLGIAINPAGTKAYVANQYDSTISVIDTATNNVTATLNVGSGPLGVAVNPAGTKVYVANYWSNSISVIDTATNTVISFPVGSYPTGVVVNPAGTKVYVVNSFSHNVYVIDTADNSVAATVNVGSYPAGIAINPAGTKVYVTNGVSSTVSIIDTATNIVTATVNVENSSDGVAVNPAGTKVYVVSYGNSSVSIIDTATNTLTATVNVGANPRGVAVNPMGTPTATPVPTFNVSGFKINNATGSGVQGWNITLTNSTMQKSMLTGADGSYKFMNLVNGTYNVTEEIQTGWTNVSSMSQQVTINGADTMKINFTNQPPTKLPIIFIPGIMGSKFNVTETFDPKISNCLPFGNYAYNQNDVIWYDAPKSLPLLGAYKSCGGIYLDVLQLKDDGQTPVYPQVNLSGNILDAYVLGPLGNEPYYDTTKYLEDAYTPGVNFFIFRYDWRKDITSMTGQLDGLIDTATSKAGTQKVNIIAHSMGGLVAREYIRDPMHAKKVNTLVELGTPHLGSVDFLAHLLYDKCLTIYVPFFNDACIMDKHEANKLVQNWTGAFELLPSKKYYQLYSNPDEYPFNDSRDIDQNEVHGPLNYDQLKTLLTNLKKNMYIFKSAEKFHDTVDPSYSNTSDFNISGVNVYIIAGSGFPTIGQIWDYKTEPRPIPQPAPAPQPPGAPTPTPAPQTVEIKQDANSTNGDGTVPLKSATLDQQNNVYYVKQKHSDLPSNSTVLRMTLHLLNGDMKIIDGVKKDPFPFNGRIISIYSPVNLHAYDAQNNHVGITNNRTVEINIPGSTYDELGESKYIYLPEGEHYRITTNATGEGSFDLKIRTYNESVLQGELSYLNVNQTNQTTASMSLDSDNPILYVDRDGDGKTVQQFPPTNITDYINTTPAPTPTQAPSGSGSGGGSSSGGGGSGGGSGENSSNIETIEKYDLQISKDALTSYRFTHPKSPIMFVNITGNTSYGIITTSVEVLKNTSSLVETKPEGLVYKNANIWVGTPGFAVPKNIKEAVITFKVENSWLRSYNLEGGDITMVRWNGSYWNQLETSQKMKDNAYTYYEAKTYAFSPFAIKGISKAAMPSVTNQSGIAQTATATPADNGTPPGAGAAPFKRTLLINWSIIIAVFAMVGIIIVVYLKRKGNFKKSK